MGFVPDNAQSPLLRLPKSVRKRIYHYVLGDTTLHCVPVEPEQSDPMLSTVCNRCCLVDADQREYKRLSLTEDTNYLDDHTQSGCKLHDGGIPRVQTFALPLVCQQLYNETEALVVKRSTFTFTSYKALLLFADSLEPFQRKAVRKIIFVQRGMRYVYPGWFTILSVFSGLREFSYHRHLSVNEAPDHKLLDEDMLRVLERLPLEKVNIRVFSKLSSAPASASMVAEIEARTKEIEDRLLHVTGSENADNRAVAAAASLS